MMQVARRVVDLIYSRHDAGRYSRSDWQKREELARMAETELGDVEENALGEDAVSAWLRGHIEIVQEK